MSRIPVPSDRSELRSLERAVKGLSRSVATGGSSGGAGGGDVSRFSFQYDHSSEGLGEQPVVGEGVFYDPLAAKVISEKYALGCVGLSQANDLTDGNSSARYPLGKFELITTSDNKVWYVGMFGTTGRTGQNSTAFNIKIYEVVEEAGVLSFDYSATQTGTIGSTSVEDFSMSNIVEGTTDTFGVAFGDVSTSSNTISFFRLIYTAGTSSWAIVGGGSNQDDTLGISYSGFDVRNGDLIYHPTQNDWLFFAVDATQVKVLRWQGSNGFTKGVITLPSKSYGVDIPVRGSRFNIATLLSDENILVLDGTTGGNWIYSYNGSAFSSTGTNNILSSFSNGFNGVQIAENVFAFEISAIKADSSVSLTIMEYNPATTTLSERIETSTHTEIEDGKGTPFISDTQAFYSSDIEAMVDVNGNTIHLDGNQAIEKVTFSDGVAATENLSLRYIQGFVYFCVTNAMPSSNASQEYSDYYWVMSKTALGNLQTDRLPIPLGRVSEVSTTFPTVDCVLESLESTSLTKGELYGDYVALSETRLIPIKKGSSYPFTTPSQVVITDATLQEILKNGYKSVPVFHANNQVLLRDRKPTRIVFEYNKDTNYENVMMNVLVNGVPYFSKQSIVASQTNYYLDFEATGSIFANIAVNNTAKAYLFTL